MPSATLQANYDFIIHHVSTTISKYTSTGKFRLLHMSGTSKYRQIKTSSHVKSGTSKYRKMRGRHYLIELHLIVKSCKKDKMLWEKLAIAVNMKFVDLTSQCH